VLRIVGELGKTISDTLAARVAAAVRAAGTASRPGPDVKTINQSAGSSLCSAGPLPRQRQLAGATLAIASSRYVIPVPQLDAG
jgi:hypothetical protein